MPFRRKEPDATESTSISTLLKRLGAETGELMRAELALAKLELREVARQAAIDGAKVGAAAALAFVGALLLAAAAVIGLAHLIGDRYALAALALGLLLLAVGGALARSGIRGMARPKTPQDTLASLREDGRLAAEHLRQLRREAPSTGLEAPHRPDAAHILRGDDA
jgi:uncharacterized membrane protein YqjE